MGPHDLERFVLAQDPLYPTVLEELAQGEKVTHWMWFIFPQIAGLGFSAMAARYAISGRAEAEAYLQHPLLSARLLECTELVLSHPDIPPESLFGYPDDLKLKSCMTLFEAVSPSGSVFERVLDTCYGGERDEHTLALLGAD